MSDSDPGESIDLEPALWLLRSEDIDLAALHDSATGVLSNGELERAARIKHDHGRRDFLAAHLLLRWALSQIAPVAMSDWRYEAEPFGKPSIAAPAEHRGIEFSLTHTRGFVAVVTAPCPVGVDAEWFHRRTDPSLADRLFAQQEVDDLHSREGDDRRMRFFEYWTLKESFVKATGAGLSQPLEQFHFEFPSPDSPTIHFHEASLGNEDAWRFRLHHERQRDFIVSVALDNSRQRDVELNSIRDVSFAPRVGRLFAGR